MNKHFQPNEIDRFIKTLFDTHSAGRSGYLLINFVNGEISDGDQRDDIKNVFFDLDTGSLEQSLDEIKKTINEHVGNYHCYMNTMISSNNFTYKRGRRFKFALNLGLEPGYFEGGKQEALNTITQFPLKPSMLVDVGFRGYDAYFLLKKPFKTNDGTEYEFIRDCESHLNDTIGGVLSTGRIPGTPDITDPNHSLYNTNDPDLWSNCTICETNDVSYTLDEINRFFTVKNCN